MTKTGMQIHPIRTKQDYRVAVARIEKLMSALPESAEGDELDILATLVDAYESKHDPIEAPDPVTAIRFRMEQNHLSDKDLEPMLGSPARVSEVLTGKRRLTLEMVRRVHQGLGISADLLIAAYPASSSRPKRAVSQGSSSTRTRVKKSFRRTHRRVATVLGTPEYQGTSVSVRSRIR